MPQIGMAVLATIRSTLLLAFSSLPLLLMTFIGFLAIGLGNMSLFLLFIGQAGIVPLVTEALHIINAKNNTLMSMNDAASLVPLMPSSGDSYTTPVNIYPTYWMAHISFFFGYILMNAIMILITPTDLSVIKNAASKETLNAKIQARTDKAGTIIGTSIALYITIFFLRYFVSGTETLFGMLLATIVLGGAGIFWYYLASLCGASNSDIFGIAIQMMSASSAQKSPKTCIYTGTPTGS